MKSQSQQFFLTILVLVFLISGCPSEKPSQAPSADAPVVEPTPPVPVAQQPDKKEEALPAEEPTQLFWGDTHLHTSFSPDAFFLENRSADPDTAYRFAKGMPIIHPYHRGRIQIKTPLDFLVVADHAEMMGVPYKLSKGDPTLTQTETGKRFMQMVKEGKGVEVFEEFITAINTGKPFPDLDDESVKRSIWEESIDITERHNEPGKFTSLIGWEWTSTPEGNNLHRVVFLSQGGDKGKKFIPFSSFQSADPEDLWKWLEETSQKHGVDFVAIPHNSNISGGLMFSEVDSKGRPITAEYARTRMKWEPLVEVTQIKGDSETHPQLSPNDEFADYEKFEHLLSTGEKATKEPDRKGDFVRSALKRGLELENKVGVNPYKVGVIGSTDSHTGAATAEEDNFWGKTAMDSIPANKAKDISMGIKGVDMGAAGLAGVWAKENTRSSLYEAFRRKEVYATSGPRIQVRFFGGWDFQNQDTQAKNLANLGYQKGVPMGGDLTKAPAGKSPTFLIRAVKDPKEANLDRIQIVKGWLGQDGKAQEKIFNVALSDDRQDVAGQAPPVGNTVDLKTGKYTNTIGDAELVTVWTDPEFDPGQRAFYYARVLQIPTPRHTLLDALALKQEPPKTHPATIQERAYTSPIWYTP